MDVSEFTSKDLNSEDAQVMLGLGITCSSRVNIKFMNTKNIHQKNVLLSLNTYGPCIIFMDNISVFAEAMNLVLISVGKEGELVPTDFDKKTKHMFKSVRVLLIFDGHTMADRILELIKSLSWPQLRSLELDHFSMKIFPEKLKLTMPLLQILRLNYNGLTTPPDFPWHDDFLIGNLTLSDSAKLYKSNYLRAELPPFVLPKVLELDYNAIEDLEHFQFQRNLHKLSLRRNGLRKINGNCFRKLSELIELNLGDNKLRTIPVALLRGLRSLTRVYFDHNRIEVIHSDLFLDLIKLKQLHLNDNKIASFRSKFLLTLQSLDIIHLENNKMQVLTDENDSQTLLQELQLKQVFLQNNLLRNVSSWILVLKHLQFLDMSSNLVTGETLFLAVNSTDTNTMVNFAHHVDDAAHGLSSRTIRRSFRLKNNKIRSASLLRFFPPSNQNVEISPAYLKTSTFLDLYDIDLTGNPIHCGCGIVMLTMFLRIMIKHKAWQSSRNFGNWKCAEPKQVAGTPILSLDTRRLVCRYDSQRCPHECRCYWRPYAVSDVSIVVDCSLRNLTKIPQTIPYNPSHTYLQLYLQQNNIGEIPATPYLQNVTSLYLSYNNISFINGDVFPLMTSIRELYLDNNKLQSLPPSIQNLTLQKLSLSVNLFKCDCNDLWIKQWLERNRKVVVDVDKVRCISGPGKGVPIVYVRDQAFVCPLTPKDNYTIVRIEKYKTIAIACSSVLSFCIVALLLMYKYRREIKVLAHAHFNLHPFDRMDDDGNNQAIYDAFVSYSSHDSDWVNDVLKETMENHVPPYRLCLHDRDFVVGAMILENIVFSLQRSRRVILVLTRHFIQSQWCLMEFRKAHQRALQRKGDYLIIVLLEEVNMDEVDEELKVFLRTNTYLSVHNQWFWKKLYYAMPLVPIRENLENNRNNPEQLHDEIDLGDGEAR